MTEYMSKEEKSLPSRLGKTHIEDGHYYEAGLMLFNTLKDGGIHICFRLLRYPSGAYFTESVEASMVLHPFSSDYQTSYGAKKMLNRIRKMSGCTHEFEIKILRFMKFRVKVRQGRIITVHLIQQGESK